MKLTRNLIQIGLGIGAIGVLAWLGAPHLRGTVPASKDWVDVTTALGTLAAVVVALFVAFVPIIYAGVVARQEARYVAVRFAIVCEVPSAAIKALVCSLSSNSENPFDPERYRELRGALSHTPMPKFSTEDLRKVSLIIGRDSSLVLTMALATVETLEQRLTVMEMVAHDSKDDPHIQNHLETLIYGLTQAQGVIDQVRQTIENKLG